MGAAPEEVRVPLLPEPRGGRPFFAMAHGGSAVQGGRVHYAAHPFDGTRHAVRDGARRAASASWAPIRIRVFHMAADDRAAPADKLEHFLTTILPAATGYWQSTLRVVRAVRNLTYTPACVGAMSQDGKIIYWPNSQPLPPNATCFQYTSNVGCSDVVDVPTEHLNPVRKYKCFTSGRCVDLGENRVGGPGVADADFVLYASMADSSICSSASGARGSTIAYAGVCERDQYDRPTHGTINWCPHMLRTDAASIEKHIATAVHELGHALGFVQDSFPLMRDVDAGGAPRTARLPNGATARVRGQCHDGFSRWRSNISAGTIAFGPLQPGAAAAPGYGVCTDTNLPATRMTVSECEAAARGMGESHQGNVSYSNLPARCLLWRRVNGGYRYPRAAGVYWNAHGSGYPALGAGAQHGVQSLCRLPAPETRVVARIVTPRVRRYAREHFGCASLAGAELESHVSSAWSICDGESARCSDHKSAVACRAAAASSDGGCDWVPYRCLNSHWDERLFFNNLMSPVDQTQTFVPKLLLAFLEDTGWYQADYERAVDPSWGFKRGCDFVHQPCIVAPRSPSRVPAYNVTGAYTYRPCDNAQLPSNIPSAAACEAAARAVGSPFLGAGSWTERAPGCFRPFPDGATTHGFRFNLFSSGVSIQALQDAADDDSGF
eukprot:g3835.t1